MANKMLKHCNIDTQILEMEGGGLLLYGMLILKNGYDVCSAKKEIPSSMTRDVLFSKGQEAYLNNLTESLKSELLKDADSVLKGYRGFQFQRAMMGYYELN